MKHIIYVFLAMILFLASCDDGRIYEKELVIPKQGLTLKMTGEITGLDSWPSNYSLVIATFKEDNTNAESAAVIPRKDNNAGRISAKLSGIKADANDLELCIIDALRDRVISYKTLTREDFNVVGDTIYMEVGKVDVGMYNAIQQAVFDAKCISCHGANGGAPRNLFLTEGKSYAHLVNVQSKADPEYKLVNPGNPSASLLPKILNENGILHHDHADILEARTQYTLVTLIKNWIKAGAKE